MNEFLEREIKAYEVGRSHGYNRSSRLYRVEVSMFSTNVTNPRQVAVIEGIIASMFPRIDGIGGSRITRVEGRGVIRTDERPSERADGKPHDYQVAAWDVEYETSGTD